MGHHHELYAHNKLPDTFAISLEENIYPVVRYQVFIVNTPAEGFILKIQSMLVATDQGASLHPNGLLIHNNPTSFCIYESLFHLP